ncbi:type II secretion system F family protein [Kitasatospora sp. LaBMicrA B282]|uniref:type II secretion system F family protein n=1 Tax=Kitasatospora sp. LaBMicrA B282 TaxID=3420949 RepID=UPI003D0C0A53
MSGWMPVPTGRQVDCVLVALLGAAAVAAWAWLNHRARVRRRSRAVLDRWGGAQVLLRVGLQRLRWLLRPGPLWPRWLVPELLSVPCGVVAGYLLRSPVPAVAAVLLIFPSCRWRERRRAARAEHARATAVIELCAALSGELRSGATPEQALDTVTGPGRATAGLLERLGEEAVARLVAGRFGADIPAALRWLATLPGGGGGAALAACWQVATESGTGLAAALDQVADALRADLALREEVQGELAGPRTTVALLAALPAFGLVLGSALGAAPVGILLHTPLGWGCLAAGAVLEAVGLYWSGRIVRDALADLGIHGGAAARPAARAAVPQQPGRSEPPTVVGGPRGIAGPVPVRRGSRRPAVRTGAGRGGLHRGRGRERRWWEAVRRTRASGRHRAGTRGAVRSHRPRPTGGLVGSPGLEVSW